MKIYFLMTKLNLNTTLNCLSKPAYFIFRSVEFLGPLDQSTCLYVSLGISRSSPWQQDDKWSEWRTLQLDLVWPFTHLLYLNILTNITVNIYILLFMVLLICKKFQTMMMTKMKVKTISPLCNRTILISNPSWSFITVSVNSQFPF